MGGHWGSEGRVLWLQEAYLPVTPGAAAAARPQAPAWRLRGPGPSVPRRAAPRSSGAAGLSLGASSGAGEAPAPGAAGPQVQALAHLPVLLGLPLGDLAPFCTQRQLPPLSRDGSSELPQSCFPRRGQQLRQKLGTCSAGQNRCVWGPGLAQAAAAPPAGLMGAGGGGRGGPGVGSHPRIPSARGFTWQHGRGCEERRAEGGGAARWPRREAPAREQGQAVGGGNLSIHTCQPVASISEGSAPGPQNQGRPNQGQYLPSPQPSEEKAGGGKGAGGSLCVCADIFPPEVGARSKTPKKELK